MKEFDLEWFCDKTKDKQIKIESVHTDNGLIGVRVKLVVNDAEIENTQWCGGYKLKINNGNIVIYFDDYKQDKLEECSHILHMYRDDDDLIEISLPEGECWEDDRVIGFIKY